MMVKNNHQLDVMYEVFDEKFSAVASSLADVRQGFWVNREGLVTTKSDAFMFVMPHMIRSVTKNVEDH